MGTLDNVYHFALPSDEETHIKSSGRTVKQRRGSNRVNEMPDKTTQLNAEQKVRDLATSKIGEDK